jgi:hypothetical protein
VLLEEMRKAMNLMERGISGLHNETINQLRRLKTILEKHSYNAKTVADVDTSNYWLPVIKR